MLNAQGRHALCLRTAAGARSPGGGQAAPDATAWAIRSPISLVE
jgi:hypothetical protein